MGLCTSCGRQAATAERFCTGCGAPVDVEQAGPADISSPLSDVGASSRLSDVGSDRPLSDFGAGSSRLSDFGDLAPRDPYGYLYATPRQHGDTSVLDVRSAAADPVPRWNEEARLRPGPPPSSVGRIAVAAAFAILAAAAAGAVLALIHFRALAPASQPARPAHSAQSSPAARHPTPTAGASPARSPAAGTSMVAVAPGAAYQPHAEAVVAFLTNYFAAINGHDYLAYRRLLSTGVQHTETPQKFGAGYQTTADSAARLESVAAAGAGAGRLAATFTFISHQAPADSPSHAACNEWGITLYLVPSSTGYLISKPPPGYRASYQNCP